MIFGRRRRAHRGGGFGGPAVLPLPINAGLLEVQVHDEVGKPLSGVTVEILNWGGHHVVHGETDPFGMFVATLHAGTYSVTARAAGHRLVTTGVEIAAGGHSRLGPLTLESSEELALPRPGLWRIDPAHSSIRFTARHLALSRIHGQFNRFAGTIEITSAVEGSLIDLVIDAASVDTRNEQRDAHLRSADFLDVDRFPTIEFVSTRFTHLRGQHWRIDGSLNMHGTAGDVRLDTAYLGTREWNGSRTACTATTQLHRGHFTLNWQQVRAGGVAVVGSTIEILLDIQAVHEV